MAVAIDEMSVEVAPPAAAAPTHGAGSGAGASAGQVNPVALHKMMTLLQERNARLKVS